MVFLFGLLLVGRRLGEFADVWRSPRHLGILLLTATILACNWGLYISSIFVWLLWIVAQVGGDRPDGWTDGRNTADYASGSGGDQLLDSYRNRSLGAKRVAHSTVDWVRRGHFHAVTLV